MSTTTTARVSGAASTTIKLYITDCPTCGTIFGISEQLKERRYADGKDFYCPNGHILSWHESEEDRQRKRAELAERRQGWAETRAKAARDQAEAAHNSARAYKGHLTRMRNRIANGVCPVQGCRRNFADVKAHVLTQHPAWVHEHPEALS